MIASGLLPASRRPNPCPRSSKPFLDMSHLPAGARRLQLPLNCAAKQETWSSRALFPKIQFLSPCLSRSFAHFNAPDQWSRARRYWARLDHDVYFQNDDLALRGRPSCLALAIRLSKHAVRKFSMSQIFGARSRSTSRSRIVILRFMSIVTPVEY